MGKDRRDISSEAFHAAVAIIERAQGGPRNAHVHLKTAMRLAMFAATTSNNTYAEAVEEVLRMGEAFIIDLRNSDDVNVRRWAQAQKVKQDLV